MGGKLHYEEFADCTGHNLVLVALEFLEPTASL
jgi:hypothetical protein